jgi:hypothetical protein
MSNLASGGDSTELVARLKRGDAQAVEQAVEQVIGEVEANASNRKAIQRLVRHEGVKQLREAGEGITFWSAFHRRAMPWLRQSLLLTVVTIGFCLVLLPLVPATDTKDAAGRHTDRHCCIAGSGMLGDARPSSCDNSLYLHSSDN